MIINHQLYFRHKQRATQLLEAQIAAQRQPLVVLQMPRIRHAVSRSDTYQSNFLDGLGLYPLACH